MGGGRDPALSPFEEFGNLKTEVKDGLLYTVRNSRNEMANYYDNCYTLKSQLYFKLEGRCNK